MGIVEQVFAADDYNDSVDAATVAGVAQTSLELLGRVNEQRVPAVALQFPDSQGWTAYAFGGAGTNNLFDTGVATPLRQALFGLTSNADKANLVDMNDADDKRYFTDAPIVGIGCEWSLGGEYNGVIMPADFLEQIRRALNDAFKIAVLPTASETTFNVYWTPLGMFDRDSRRIDFQAIPPTILKDNAGTIKIGMINSADGDLSGDAYYKLPSTNQGSLTAGLKIYFKIMDPTTGALIIREVGKKLGMNLPYRPN